MVNAQQEDFLMSVLFGLPEIFDSHARLTIKTFEQMGDHLMKQQKEARDGKNLAISEDIDQVRFFLTGFQIASNSRVLKNWREVQNGFMAGNHLLINRITNEPDAILDEGTDQCYSFGLCIGNTRDTWRKLTFWLSQDDALPAPTRSAIQACAKPLDGQYDRRLAPLPTADRVELEQSLESFGEVSRMTASLADPALMSKHTAAYSYLCAILDKGEGHGAPARIAEAYVALARLLCSASYQASDTHPVGYSAGSNTTYQLSGGASQAESSSGRGQTSSQGGQSFTESRRRDGTWSGRRHRPFD